MDMQEQLRKIQEEAANQLENVRDKAGLDALRLKMLGKKGDLTQLLRSMGQLPAEERPKAGQMINVVRGLSGEYLCGRTPQFQTSQSWCFR